MSEQKTSNSEAPIFVVGAGPSGLAAAWRLRKLGRPVVVLEARDRVGGQLCTVRENGYLMEAGTVILPSAYTGVMQLVEEAGITAELVQTKPMLGYVRDKTIHNIRADHLVLDALKSGLLSWGAKLRLLRLGFDSLRANPHLSYEDLSLAAAFDDETPAQYAQRVGLGQEVYDYMVDPTVRGALGARSDKVSKAEFLFAFNKVLGSKLYAFREGYSTFPQALAKPLDVRLGAKVREVVEEDNGRVRVSWDDAAGSHTEYGAGCIVTTYGHVIADIVPQLEAESAGFLRRLEFTTCINVNVAMSRPTPGIDASLIVIPRPVHEGMFGITFSHNQVPGRVPPGKGLSCLYSTTEWGVKHFEDDDATIAKRFVDGADSIIPGFSNDIEFTRVTRWYPVLVYSHPGLYRELGRIKDKLKHQGRIHLGGSCFSSSCVNTAVVAGERAARDLATSL